MPTPARHQFQIFIDRAPEDVWAFLTNLRNLARTTAPQSGADEVLSDPDAVLAKGTRITYRVAGGKTLVTEIVEWSPPLGFAEKQTSGPYQRWLHRRRLAPFQDGTLLTETLEYQSSGGLASALARLVVETDLDMEPRFNHRQKETKRILEQVGRIKGRQEERRQRLEQIEEDGLL